MKRLTVFALMILCMGAAVDDNYTLPSNRDELKPGFTCPDGELPVIPYFCSPGGTTPAGRGGTVYKVTNLNSSGSGSLLACLQASGPRVCIFEVAGEIPLTGDFTITNPYLTVAGQTAPYPGIHVDNAGLRIATHDVLFQHFSIRPGTTLPYDGTGNGATAGAGLSIRGKDFGSSDTSNIVIDHMSFTHAWNKPVETWDNNDPANSVISDLTISNSIIAEALYDAPGDNTYLEVSGAAGTAFLLGGGATSYAVMNNLISNSSHRFPLLKGATNTLIVNNMMYNPGYRIMFTDGLNPTAPTYSTIINNYGKLGQNGSQIYLFNLLDSGSYYLSGNSHTYTILQNNQGSGVLAASPIIDPSTYNITPMAAADVPEYIQVNAGARPAERHPVDTRIVNDAIDGTGQLVDCKGANDWQENGGTASECTRNAGWTTPTPTTRALSVPANPSSDDNGDGYTNLEEWLHSYAAGVE